MKKMPKVDKLTDQLKSINFETLPKTNAAQEAKILSDTAKLVEDIHQMFHMQREDTERFNVEEIKNEASDIHETEVETQKKLRKLRNITQIKLREAEKVLLSDFKTWIANGRDTAKKPASPDIDILKKKLVEIDSHLTKQAAKISDAKNKLNQATSAYEAHIAQITPRSSRR